MKIIDFRQFIEKHYKGDRKAFSRDTGKSIFNVNNLYCKNILVLVDGKNYILLSKHNKVFSVGGGK